MKAEYYADCKSHDLGQCRNCGRPPTGRFTYYCGAACRDVFEADHFWSTARWTAIDQASIFRIIPAGARAKKAHLPDETIAWQQRRGSVCACCGRMGFGEGEVNHIAPVNGERGFFSCANHQDNLEVLCHPCHVMATREQRRRGIIGPDGTCESLRAIDLLRGLAEPVRVRQVALA